MRKLGHLTKRFRPNKGIAARAIDVRALLYFSKEYQHVGTIKGVCGGKSPLFRKKASHTERTTTAADAANVSERPSSPKTVALNVFQPKTPTESVDTRTEVRYVMLTNPACIIKLVEVRNFWDRRGGHFIFRVEKCK